MLSEPSEESNSVLNVLGEALAARYALLREIGRGGTAIVFLAHERHPRRPVAIKVLDPAIASRLARDCFVREVELCSNVGHPHCVPVFAAGEAGGLLYYVMPYVAGESLRQRLDREGTLALEDSLRIALEAAEVLGAAHAQGIIHRDITPDNILLAGGHALVADFGIALAISAAGGERGLRAGPLGTPGYISPEQTLGTRSVDARTDVFSLGCVLYEMLLGTPPATAVHGGSSGRTWHRNLSGVERRRLATVPAQVEQVLRRALAWLPDDRFASGAEFAAAVDALRKATASRRLIPRVRRSIVALLRGMRLQGR